MKPNRIISTLLIFAFSATSLPGFDRHCDPACGGVAMTKLAPQSRLAQDGQIEALSRPNAALYEEICGDISRTGIQVISLEKSAKDLTKAITDAISPMSPEQFGKIAPHLVSFLKGKYEQYKDSSYDLDKIRVCLGIIAGIGKIGEKAAEAKLKPVVSSTVEILGGALKGDYKTSWLRDTHVEALGEIGETLMLSEVEGCEDIAKRITAVLRGYINEGRGFAYVAVAETAIKGLGKIGIKEDETVSMLRAFAKEDGSVLQAPAKVVLRQLGASEVEPGKPDIISGLINQFRQSPDPESKISIIHRLHGMGLHAVRALQAATRRDPAVQVMIKNVTRDIDYPRDPSASRRGGFTSYKLPLVIVGSAVIAFALPALLPYIAAIFGAGGTLALAPIGGLGEEAAQDGGEIPNREDKKGDIREASDKDTVDLQKLLSSPEMLKKAELLRWASQPDLIAEEEAEKIKGLAIEELVDILKDDSVCGSSVN